MLRFSKLKQLWPSKTVDRFQNIEGLNDVKEIISRSLDTDENYNLLLCGPPASSKTLFLMGILDTRKDGCYFDGSNTTSRILDVLEQERPQIILIDELDKMPRTFQNQLLNFIESGRVKVDQIKRQYNFEIRGAKVFCSANDVRKLTKPLQSRFMKIFLPRYTEDQFIAVSQKVLPKLSSVLSAYIGKLVFAQGGDIRNVIAIGKLVRKEDGPVEVELIVSTVTKYGREEENLNG